MSVQEKKSFFSTIPGLVTGVAALLTGIVGLLTVSTQLGWIGDGGDGVADQPGAGPAATTGGAGASPSGGAGAGAALSFDASPSQLTFGGLAGDEQRVTVRNTGGGVIRFDPITVTGPNRDQFRLGANDCTGGLNPGRTCSVTVTFVNTRSGESTGTLVIQPAGESPPAREVPLKGTRLL